MVDFKTPGVYVKEKDSFGRAVTAAETAVAAFVGATQRQPDDYEGQAIRLRSLKEYEETFGAIDQPKVTIENGKAVAKAGGLLYYSVRLFFANGGSDCFIVSTGTSKPNDGDLISHLDSLEDTDVPTLVVVPDAVSLEADKCYKVQQAMFAHAIKMRDRIALFDVINNDVENFRKYVSSEDLSFGAAYYPMLKTNVVTERDLSITSFLPADFEGELGKETLAEQFESADVKNFISGYRDQEEEESQAAYLNNLHEGLLELVPDYKKLVNQATDSLNVLPPSPAIAGAIRRNDDQIGVFKAPANMPLNNVVDLTARVNDTIQRDLNVDAKTGKSINAIRVFPDGIKIWGARTLNGNSRDWRYVNVRRTMLFLQQSIKTAMEAYVFANNTPSTWTLVNSDISTFLLNFWRVGGLMGDTSDQAYSVTIGLGSTMTSMDILDGIMRVSVKVCLIRPAEFIEITFEQQMPEA